MPFKVEFIPRLEATLRKAVKDLPRTEAVIRFWSDLKAIVDWLAENPTEIGELCYEYKHAKFQSRVAAHNYFGVQFAVNTEHNVVIVQKLSLSGNHSYPEEIQAIFPDDQS